MLRAKFTDTAVPKGFKESITSCLDFQIILGCIFSLTYEKDRHFVFCLKDSGFYETKKTELGMSIVFSQSEHGSPIMEMSCY